MKKLFKSSGKQVIVAAIACISLISACQQPEPPTATPTATTPATSTTTPAPAPTDSPSPSPTSSPTSSPTATPSPEATQGAVPTMDAIAGEYTVVLDPKVLAEAEKEGVKSVTGQWTIKSEGKFEATLKAVSVKGEEQEIRTAGTISIEGGKVVSQVETVNGETPAQAPPKQPYTLSVDGKELQAEGQPVKLVRK